MRVATYNVENLFSRPAVLNMKDNDHAAKILAKISEFTGLLELNSYASKKKRIENLHAEVKGYISINIRSSTVGRFLFTAESKLVAKGRGDWDGFVDLQRERFSDEQIKFTGKVIKTVDADIQCFVEVESAGTLKRFNTDILASRFADRIVIDGNDPRGIDIALGASKSFPILSAKTNIFARDKTGTIFSRDCLEVELGIGKTKRLHVLVNHFKAKDREPEKSDAKRKRQAAEVSRILANPIRSQEGLGDCRRGSQRRAQQQASCAAEQDARSAKRLRHCRATAGRSLDLLLRRRQAVQYDRLSLCVEGFEQACRGRGAGAARYVEISRT